MPESILTAFSISIHALREEGDVHTKRHSAVLSDFYPRPPRGGRRVPVYASERGHDSISIHALREEGDRYVPGLSAFWQNFYPRPPRGGRHETR